MILEGYIGNWRKYPEDEIKVRVARPSILAPSEGLLNDYKQGKISWNEYTGRYREEIHHNPDAIKKILEIARLSKEKDVRLICYEKNPPCHRFLLLEMIVRLQSAEMEPSRLF